MVLKEITLLSEDEYIKYRPLIPNIRNWWWLKSRNPRYDEGVRAVENTGYLTDIYCHVSYGGVRPFCLFKFESTDFVFWYKPDKLVGTKIQCGKYTWTILDIEGEKVYALCDEIIIDHCFDKFTNVWENSALKRYLEVEVVNFLTTN